MAVPLTDQAIAKIKDLIISREFTAGARLPREQDLAARLGLSRTSLREAVRALTLIGVLDTRVGDGTYVTSLDADVLLTGMGFVGDLLDGTTLLEVHQVRRILEPVATGLAATRLTEDDFAALEACLRQMDEAEMHQAFVDADTEFHRIIVSAAGNATLASLILNLSGGMARARLWRTITEHDAVEITKQRHRDIYVALRAGDAEQASAADLLHLADGERWLQRRLASGQGRHGPDGGGKSHANAGARANNGARRPSRDTPPSGVVS
jgi:GntR family transcriptional regulator, transcriptional repressor for pyruvate dehydrogenase complex